METERFPLSQEKEKQQHQKDTDLNSFSFFEGGGGSSMLPKRKNRYLKSQNQERLRWELHGERHDMTCLKTKNLSGWGVVVKKKFFFFI